MARYEPDLSAYRHCNTRQQGMEIPIAITDLVVGMKPESLHNGITGGDGASRLERPARIANLQSSLPCQYQEQPQRSWSTVCAGRAVM
jgi:hypothetical protein